MWFACENQVSVSIKLIVNLFVHFHHISILSVYGIFLFFKKWSIDRMRLTLQIAKIDWKFFHWYNTSIGIMFGSLKTWHSTYIHLSSGLYAFNACQMSTMSNTFVCSVYGIIWINQSHLVSCDSDKFNSKSGIVRNFVKMYPFVSASCMKHFLSLSLTLLVCGRYYDGKHDFCICWPHLKR